MKSLLKDIIGIPLFCFLLLLALFAALLEMLRDEANKEDEEDHTLYIDKANKEDKDLTKLS